MVGKTFSIRMTETCLNVLTSGRMESNLNVYNVLAGKIIFFRIENTIKGLLAELSSQHFRLSRQIFWWWSEGSFSVESLGESKAALASVDALFILNALRFVIAGFQSPLAFKSRCFLQICGDRNFLFKKPVKSFKKTHLS